MSTVRVRFAPSPTGFFHIGSARTALFNWLYARHTGGKFILRIEDTDKERNSDAFLQVILDSMRWLGMDWDEGPGVGGDFGPYFQSQRNDLYRAKLKELADKGRAYEKDGAWWLRLEGARSTVFDDHLKKEIEKVDAAPMVLDDLVRGRVERAEDRDFVIFRSNGEPVFHFVNVVDDIEMQITHVIRGEDHLSNTSKHLELFKAFGVEPPKYAHIPLILKTDGPGKMSKRDRGALIEEYQQRRYLPEAVRNYLCLLGWTPTDGREVLPIADIIAQFEVGAVHQSNARFDERKMSNVNMQTRRLQEGRERSGQPHQEGRRPAGPRGRDPARPRGLRMDRARDGCSLRRRRRGPGPQAHRLLRARALRRLRTRRWRPPAGRAARPRQGEGVEAVEGVKG